MIVALCIFSLFAIRVAMGMNRGAVPVRASRESLKKQINNH
jgi:hypothetical protein